MKRIVLCSISLIVGLMLILSSAVSVHAQQSMKTIEAKALDDHGCDSTEWHFVINQIDTEANAPGSIHVTWANGNSEDVSLSKFTGGVAHYSTKSNLDSTVIGATAMIYDTWSGEFNLSHGPCGTSTATPTLVTPTETKVTNTPPVKTKTPEDEDPTPTPRSQDTGSGDSVPWIVPIILIIALFFMIGIFRPVKL